MTMNIAKRTNLSPVRLGYVIDSDRPLIPFCVDVENASCAAPHSHPRAQVIFASSGVMKVITANNMWFVPPMLAVWVPPKIEHQVQFPGKVSIRNLFIDPLAARTLPSTCMVFCVTPLMRELILCLDGSASVPCRGNRPTGRIIQVILDELAQIKSAPLNLPMSDEPRLRKLMDALCLQPGDERSLADWAKVSGASVRTLARLFIQETGMTFGHWRKQLRMLEAIDRLSHGEYVTKVAFDLGYQNLSAFIAAFRKVLGTTPGKYFVRSGRRP